MNPKYSLREQKIYSDYYQKPNSELEFILENKKNYNQEIISIIEDILLEKGVLKEQDILKDKVNLDKNDFIHECIYNNKLKEYEIIDQLVSIYGISIKESQNIIKEIYSNEKESLKSKFHFKQPINKILIRISVLMACLSLISYNINSYSNFYVRVILLVINYGIYFIGLYYTIKYSRILNKRTIWWVLFYLPFSIIVMVFLAYSDYTFTKPLQSKVDALKYELKLILEKLNKSLADYKNQVYSIEQKYNTEFYELLYNYLILNNIDYNPIVILPDQVTEKNNESLSFCPACNYKLNSTDNLCPDCGLKLN